MRTIIPLPTAEADYLRIYEHYAYERGAPHVALKIEASIIEAINKHLAFNPAIGRKLNDDDSTVRAYLAIKSHWVLYRYTDEVVYIRRIIAAKEISSWDNIDL